MAIGTRSYARSYLSPAGLPPGIKWLLIVNVAIFLVQYFSRGTRDRRIPLLLRPGSRRRRQAVLHLAAGDVHVPAWGHLAHPVEHAGAVDVRQRTRTDLGHAALPEVLLLLRHRRGHLRRDPQLFPFGNPSIPTVGSSGAIFGILLVSAVLWPDRVILFSFLFPIKMKYFVAIIGGIAFLNSFNINSGVSDVGHLGGMVFGYLFLKLPKTRGFDPLGSVEDPTRPGNWRGPRRSFRCICVSNAPTAAVG